MAISLTVATTGGFVGGVNDLDFPFTVQEKNVGAHLVSLFWGGRDDYGGGVFEGTGSRVRVEEAGGGHSLTFGVEDGRFQVDKMAFRVDR